MKCGDALAFDEWPDVYSGNQDVALSVLNPVSALISANTLKEKLTVASLREAASVFVPKFAPVAMAA